MPQLQTQFITCPKCNGIGRDDKKITCTECNQLSIGTFIKNDFLYWGYNLTPVKILVRQSKIIFDYVINIALLIFAFTGLIAIGWWFFNNGADASISFWGIKSSYLLWFWWGVLAGIFLYFRWRRQQEQYPSVKVLYYRAQIKLQKKTQRIPNNWQELKNFKTKIDVSKSFSKEVLKIIDQAYEIALNFKHDKLTPAHLILALTNPQAKTKNNTSLKMAKAIFTRLNIFQGKIGPKLEQRLKELPASDNAQNIPVVSRELKQAFIDAYLDAFDRRDHRINIFHLLSFLIANDQILNSLFQELNVKTTDVYIAARWVAIQETLRLQQTTQKRQAIFKFKSSMRKSTMAVATPLLNYFCDDLTQQARLGFLPILVDQPNELKQICQTFNNKNRQLLLTGEPGVGKKVLVKILAKRIVKDDVPRQFRHKQILSLDMNKIQQDADKVSLEKKLLALVGELIKDKSIILFIHDMTPEIWEVLSQYSGKFNLIATANKPIANESLKNIAVTKPADDIVITILASHALLTEQKYKVQFLYEALTLIHKAGVQHMNHGSNITHTVNFLESAAQQANKQGQKIITAKLAAEAVSQITKVPYTHILK